MKQQVLNQEILEKLNQIQIDINILKERLPEEEPEFDVEKQIEEGLEDLKESNIIKLV